MLDKNEVKIIFHNWYIGILLLRYFDNRMTSYANFIVGFGLEYKNTSIHRL